MVIFYCVVPKNTFFKVTLKEKIHKISEWIIPYMFDYEI
jgi:hypothetical protein